MATRRNASAALVGALVAWLLRGGVIAVVDGPLRGALEVVLLVAGLVLYLGGAVLAGVCLAPDRTTGPVVLRGFVGFAIGSLILFLSQTALGLVTPSNAGWAWGEAPLWAAAGLGVIVWLSVQDGLDAT
jgi:hypothetical protein